MTYHINKLAHLLRCNQPVPDSLLRELAATSGHKYDTRLDWSDIEMIQHSLGYKGKRGSGGYRNYYAAGSSDKDRIERLVDLGFMVRGCVYSTTDTGETLHYYHVTKEGACAAGCLAVFKRLKKYA